MSMSITVSDKIYQRLKEFAKFDESLDVIIERLIQFHDRNHNLEDRDDRNTKNIVINEPTNTKPVRIIFKSDNIPVTTWKEVLIKLCESLHKNHPQEFEKILNLPKYFSKERYHFHSPIEIKSTGIYVETNRGSKAIMMMCYKTLSLFGYSQEDFKVITGKIQRTNTKIHQQVINQKDWKCKGVVFPEETQFRANYKGNNYYGVVQHGTLVVNGNRFNSPSAAAVSITNNSVNGWIFWECKFPGEEKWRIIKSLRIE